MASTILNTTTKLVGTAPETPFYATPRALLYYNTTYPWYHSHKPQLLPWCSDTFLVVASPVFAYWAWSLVFHFLDVTDWRFLDKYRIHDSKEVSSRNRATKMQVVWAVILQQVIQTAAATAAVLVKPHEEAVDFTQEILTLGAKVALWGERIFGAERAEQFLRVYGPEAVWYTYWWGIPLAQLVFAMYVV